MEKLHENFIILPKLVILSLTVTSLWGFLWGITQAAGTAWQPNTHNVLFYPYTIKVVYWGNYVFGYTNSSLFCIIIVKTVYELDPRFEFQSLNL